MILECTICGGKYIREANECDLINHIQDLQNGVAVYSGCPLCEDGTHAILAE
jgi:hypothetical protein